MLVVDTRTYLRDVFRQSPSSLQGSYGWGRPNPSAFYDYPRDPYAALRVKIAQRPNRYADVLYHTLSLLTAIVTFPVDTLSPIPRLQREARQQQLRAAELIELLAPWIGRSPPGGYTLANVRDIYTLRRTAATYAAAFFETQLELAREELRYALHAHAPRDNISGDDLPFGHPLRYAIPTLYAYVRAVTDFPEDSWTTDDDKAMDAWRTATRIRDDIEKRTVDNLWSPAEWNQLYPAGIQTAADFFTVMASRGA